MLRQLQVGMLSMAMPTSTMQHWLFLLDTHPNRLLRCKGELAALLLSSKFVFLLQ